MRSTLLLSATALVLAGCQASNPYQGESIPLPPAPAAAAQHFDASAYPAPAQLKNYNYWCWPNTAAPNALLNDSAQRILAEQLEQYGLRAAQSAQQCELQVHLSSQHSERVRHDYDNYPSLNYGVGYGHHRSLHNRHGYSGLGLNVPITPRRYIEYRQQLTLVLIEQQSQQPIWRTQSSVSSNQHGQASEEALRNAFRAMLESYRQQH